jgi:hypothetical protein
MSRFTSCVLRTVGTALVTCVASQADAAAPVPLLTLPGENADDQFGFSVDGLGDFLGDGFPDYAIGASLNDDGGQSAGKVQIFPGGESLPATPALELIGAAGDLFGDALASVGDVTGDSHPDLVVGALRNDENGVDAGKIYLFAGGPAADATPDLVVRGAPGERFGESVGAIGDVNADGEADFAVGAPRAGAGVVYVFFGGADLDTVPDLVLTGETDGDRFGWAIAAAGDLDGDTIDDFVVGAPRYSTGATWRGAAYVYLGGATPDTIPDLVIPGESAGDGFGSSVDGGVDLTDDGMDDLLVGAPDANVATLIDAGRAYLFAGGIGFDVVPDLTLGGEAAAAQFGVVLAGTGDVDGDGHDDFAVGSPGFDGNRGKVYVYRAGASLDGTADFTFTGAAAEDRFGAALAHAGDVNLNLAQDVLVGAWGAGVGGEATVFGDNGPTTEVTPSTPPVPGGATLSVSSTPLRGIGHVELVLERAARVRTTLFDVGGRAIVEWPERTLAAGRHRSELDPASLSPGVYFLRALVDGRAVRSRVVVTR